MPTPAERKLYTFASTLAEWSAANGRSFPWRTATNPFHLLMAELLLRKTQAERVEPIYTELTARFSTPDEVLRVNKGELLAMLSPLGLTRRVAYLLDLCGQLVGRHEGIVPREYTDLRQLKGVGPYTANMVLCVSYEQPTLPVDNNIARLVSRVFGLARRGDTRREVDVERTLANVSFYGGLKRLTFAMLDFAALVCTARNPDCRTCVMKHICCWAESQAVEANRRDAASSAAKLAM
jgi:A/G-specific adenine glycosylase